MLLIQFGGASGGGYLSKRQRREAMDVLEKKGHFEKGTLQYIDENGIKHDEYQAFWKQIKGSNFVYPTPRYNDLVLMNPESFDWVADEAPGVACKWLATFTERRLRVGFIRVNPGASLTIKPGGSTRLLFLAKGMIRHEERDYGEHTALSCEPQDKPLVVTAQKPTEFLYVQLPTF
jgi:hypothetical protein